MSWKVLTQIETHDTPELLETLRITELGELPNY